MSRPIGIFPGGNVFQLPPPVVDASVPTSEAAGCARAGVSTGCASATSGADGFAAGGGAGALFAGAGGGGVWTIGVDGGAGGAEADFSAIRFGVAEAEACGFGLPLANLPFGGGVGFVADFPFFGKLCLN